MCPVGVRLLLLLVTLANPDLYLQVVEHKLAVEKAFDARPKLVDFRVFGNNFPAGENEVLQVRIFGQDLQHHPAGNDAAA